MASTPTKQPGKNGYQHREQYGIVVICTDEKHQQQVFGALSKEGYKLKVVTV
jgi:hypothetical protein